VLIFLYLRNRYFKQPVINRGTDKLSTSEIEKKKQFLTCSGNSGCFDFKQRERAPVEN